MNKKQSKIRWIVMGFAAVLLVVFAIIMFFNKSLAQTIILYTTSGVLLGFSVIRFIPILKHTTDKRSKMINTVEVIGDIVLGLIMIFISIQTNGNDIWMKLYRYLLSLALFSRGTIFIVEGMYCDGEKSVTKFIIHLAFIVCATSIITLNVDINNIIYLIIVIALLSGIYCGVESFKSFNNNKKNPSEKEQEVQEEVEETPTVEAPILDKEETVVPIIDHEDTREETYVN